MSESVIIAGKGVSAYQFDWVSHIGTPIMAVSGGCHAVPDMQHFISLDKPMHFPEWLTGSTRFTKHVPDNKFKAFWRQFPCVRVWEYIDCDMPTFDDAGPLVSGPLPRNYSLLMAVQVAARLGYRRCIFIGCDLLDNELYPIGEVLKSWQPVAQRAGIEWLNASPISVLRGWMEPAEEMAVLNGD